MSSASSPVEFVLASPTPPVNAMQTGAKQATEPGRSFENGEPLAARVNDQPVYLEAYEREVSLLSQAIEKQRVNPDSGEGEDFSRIQKQVLDGMLDQVIIEQQAEILELGLTNEEVEVEVKQIVGLLSDEQFEQWLADNGLTPERFRANLQAQMIANKVFDHITRDVPPVVEQVKVSFLKLNDQDAALRLKEQLKSGEKLVNLAEDYLPGNPGSDDGDGWFPRYANIVPAAVEKVAFSMELGSVEGPIKTEAGFYVIQLEAKELDRPLTEAMHQTLKKRIFVQWLQDIKLSAVIEKYVVL